MDCPDPAPVARELQQILETGSRWERGGLDPQRGAGCYGLIYWAFGRIGLPLPPTAEEGQRHFEIIEPPYQAWDVLLFHCAALQGERHLGLLFSATDGYHISISTNGVARFSLLQPVWQRMIRHGLRYKGWLCT